MKTTTAYYSENIEWDCPYKTCGACNLDEYHGESTMECWECKNEVKVKVEY